MKTYFTINNRRYEAKEFDFNLVCDLQEMGVDILDIASIRKTPTTIIRSYLALCMDGDKEIAGVEMQNHIVGGGNFDEILNVIMKKMEESDFFQALSKEAEANTQAESKKAKKEK